METVVSTTMRHPNIVQVFHYTLQPLTKEGGGCVTGVTPQQQQAAAAGGAGGSGGSSSGGGGNELGWELRLLMEYCDQVGGYYMGISVCVSCTIPPLIWLHWFINQLSQCIYMFLLFSSLGMFSLFQYQPC
jgi:hypothetical protein